MFDKLIGGAIAKIIGEEAGTAVVAYFDKKQELKQELKLAKLNGKIAVTKARAQYKLQQLQQEGNWSQGMIAQMSGWKDEAVLIIVSLPLIRAAFDSAGTLDMFQTLEQTPEWYRYMLITIYLAIYGIKPALDKLGFWKRKKTDD